MALALVMSIQSSTIYTIVNRIEDLFHKNVDPTLLDSRVLYNCTSPWSYTLSTLPQHTDALAFYSKKWGPDLLS